ncbi:MAG: hypothetical protein WEB13_10585 [Dehalococcoidia bacterium]
MTARACDRAAPGRASALWVALVLATSFVLVIAVDLTAGRLRRLA